MKKKNVLIVGSGGRESALAWKCSQSPTCGQLFLAPGSPGTMYLGENLPVKADDYEGLIKSVKENNINLVIIGPEQPLADGLADQLRNHTDALVIGPGKEGALLESSKSYAKEFMNKYNIPAAASETFSKDDEEQAIAYINNHTGPYVIKADGLAAGKGVIIEKDQNKAIEWIKKMFSGHFGEAGEKIVIEEFLEGKEFSVFIITNGEDYLILPHARDYKKAKEGDKGPNTGGMGAVSPVYDEDASILKKTKEKIIDPTLQGLRSEKKDYQGFLFFGLIDVDGEPYVIEYNCRLGDPEAQVILPRLNADLVDMCFNIKGNKVAPALDKAAAAVIAASGGYPLLYNKGYEISGLQNVKNCLVFLAGTDLKDDMLVTAGGRVLALVALGDDHRDALNKCYDNMEEINFKNIYYRTDIGHDIT